MVLYEKDPSGSEACLLEWWAVEVDSLTLAHCQVSKKRKFELRYVKWSGCSDSVETFPPTCDLGEATLNLLIGCREFHSHLLPCPASIWQIDTSQTTIPEYILLGPADGPAEAIMHTVEPVFICAFPDGPAARNPADQFISYRLHKPLPPAGWEYWRTDAWQEFAKRSERELIPEMLRAAGGTQDDPNPKPSNY